MVTNLHLLRLDRFAGRDEEDLLARYGGLLSPDEHERQMRPTLEKRRREVLLTRALVRTVLSSYTGADPRDWRFGVGEHGRPFVEGLPFDFNLAHTEGMIACLVSDAPSPGVDVEFMSRRGKLDEVAEHFFARPECEDLRRTEEGGKRRRFFDYWTLKEAYIKARGLGLVLPLDAFWFSLAGDRPSISFDHRIEDDPAAWRFETLELSADHLCSVALKTAEPLDIALIEAAL